MNTNEFEIKLASFLSLLKKERKVLIKGDALKLEEILAKKELFVSLFNDYQGEITEKMRQLISEIQAQQEENLLLTQQAMSFQDMLLDTLKSGIKKANNTTYGGQTNYGVAPTTLIDTEA